MREERVDASLSLGRVEHKLGFAVLLRHGIVATDDHRTEDLTIRRHPHSKNDEIRDKRQRDCSQNRQNTPQQGSPQPSPKIVDREPRHDAKL